MTFKDYNPQFRVKVEVMHNPTGAVRANPAEELYCDRDHAEFMYSDGNYACDCNRGLFFSRWAPSDAPERDPEHECDDKRYSARLTDIATGEVFYADGLFEKDEENK